MEVRCCIGMHALSARSPAAFPSSDNNVPTCGSVYSHLVRNPDVAWADIPDLPKAASKLLDEKFARSTSRIATAQRSVDGTIKLLVTLQDGLQVESVIMTYDTTGGCCQLLGCMRMVLKCACAYACACTAHPGSPCGAST